ncbi:MAG: hypothetical protein JW779_04915, partial [Candidatus Thorarchaeota archaeon]|nr:hypothetical protein [Candidatus Thorarchaeota archaeon]
MTMLDFSIVGPITGIFAIADVTIHLFLDIKKARAESGPLFREPSTPVPSSALGAASLSTVLSFILVLMFPVAWVLDIGELYVLYQLPLLIDTPDVMWILGLALLLFGIVLHSWSRYHRKDMASSWS